MGAPDGLSGGGGCSVGGRATAPADLELLPLLGLLLLLFRRRRRRRASS
jgi:MYXO-CTERM domain-containing protein